MKIQNERINYLELPASDIESTKLFFSSIFAWEFIDYGPEYSSFSNAGIDGGFYQSDKKMASEAGSALIVFYSDDLESTLEKIQQADAKIVKNIFSFPGGRRFHFSDPNGNEFAVWSDQ